MNVDRFALDAVLDFMTVMGQPTPNILGMPEKTRQNLRVTLLKEEVRELEEAVAENNITGVLDALCDIQYVLTGAVIEFGMNDIFEQAFDEVHRSNMSKSCFDLDEAEQTQQYHLATSGIESDIVPKENYYIVVNRETRKVLKSYKYSPANLTQFIPDEVRNS